MKEALQKGKTSTEKFPPEDIMVIKAAVDAGGLAQGCSLGGGGEAHSELFQRQERG